MQRCLVGRGAGGCKECIRQINSSENGVSRSYGLEGTVRVGHRNVWSSYNVIDPTEVVYHAKVTFLLRTWSSEASGWGSSVFCCE